MHAVGGTQDNLSVFQAIHFPGAHHGARSAKLLSTLATKGRIQNHHMRGLVFPMNSLGQTHKRGPIHPFWFPTHQDPGPSMAIIFLELETSRNETLDL